jgi:hypothetical protein
VDPSYPSGGTFARRVFSQIMPVVEFGLCNADDTQARRSGLIDDLEQLGKIFALVVERALR